jgi:hypothetical protein
MRLEHIVCQGPFLVIRSNKDTNCEATVSGAAFVGMGGTSQEPDVLFDGSGTLNMTLDKVTQARDIRLAIGKNAHVRINGSASLATLDGLSPVKGDSIKLGNVRKTYTGSRWE